MAKEPTTVTSQGFTRAHYLTGEQIEQILELVEEGLPIAVACREAGTSSRQFTMRCNREPELAKRRDDAIESGGTVLQDNLRAIGWYHVAEKKDYKAWRDWAMVLLPEFEGMRTRRFEIGNADGEAFKIAAKQAFGDWPTELIEARLEEIKLIEQAEVAEVIDE